MYASFAYPSVTAAIVLIPLLYLHKYHPALRYARNTLCVLLFISCSIWATPTKAATGAPLHKWGDFKIAFLGCNYQIARTATFCESKPPDWGQSCFCTNPHAMSSMAFCLTSAQNIQIDSFLNMCQNSYNVTVTKSQFDEALQNYTKYAKLPDEIPNFNKTTPLNVPVRLEEVAIESYRAAYDQFLGNYDRSVNYGYTLVLYWFAVFVLAAVGNWTKLIFPGAYKRLTDPVTNWFRRSISLPATKGKHKTNEKPFLKVLDMLVPTRAETLILLGFVALTIYLVQREIHYSTSDPLFLHKTPALLRYFAVRTSILTSLILPLLILFGGRNNFLQWVTRWDYSTFIAFHRWVSRVAVILISIHTFCYSAYVHFNRRRLSKTYIKAGALATLAGITILVQGLLVLRRKHYEIFLIVHIFLALVFVLGGWYHVLDLYCSWFYYFSSVIWLFDRLVRVYRLCSFGFPKAQVILLADESLKVVVPRPKHWNAIPGGHAFIHFMKPGYFWQSHPFTYTVSVEPNEDNIILFIKVKDGVTKRLYKFLSQHPGKSTEIRVGIEGSYGEETPASKSDTAVFVAGGNGIPGIYAEVLHLAKKSSLNSRQHLKLIWVVREYKSLYWFYEELLSLKNTKIDTTIYVTQPDNASCLDEFSIRFPATDRASIISLSSSDEEIMSAAASYEEHSDHNSQKQPLLHDGTQLVDYNLVHGSLDRSSITESTVESVVRQIKSELSHIHFEGGRPAIGNLVGSTVKESEGSTSFVTCGHPVMVDDLRYEVVQHISNPDKKRVDYFEQLQVWA